MARRPGHAIYRRDVTRLGWVIAGLCTAIVVGHHIEDIFKARSFEQEHALKAARTAVAKDIVIRKWITSHGGVYVPATDKTPPNQYLSHVTDRDITTPQGVRLTLMNPAYAMRQLFDFSNDPAGISTKITSLKLMNPINEPDEWERKALETLEQQKREADKMAATGGAPGSDKDGRSAAFVESMEVNEFTTSNGIPYLRLIKPLVVQKGCLKCHEHLNYRVGDIRGGISIKLNMTEYLEAQRKLVRFSQISSILIWLAGIALVIFGVRNLGRSADARDKAEQELWDMKENLESLVIQRTDDLRKTQKTLVQQEKLASLGSLSAGVAHEIRNPLNIIATSTQLMMMDDATSGENRKACWDIMGQIERITKITDSLHGFAKELIPEMYPLDLRSILDNVAASTENGMNSENMRIIRKYVDAPLMVNADPDQITRVFLQFILNARDSMAEKGRPLVNAPAGEKWKGELVISGRTSEGWVVVDVADNGVGIPPEIQDMIFDPFFTTKEVNKGAGLGLAAAYGIIENHGGTISVSSEAGNGATFTVRLPLVVV